VWVGMCGGTAECHSGEGLELGLELELELERAVKNLMVR